MSHAVRSAMLRSIVAVSAMAPSWAATDDFTARTCQVPSAPTHPLIDRGSGMLQYAQLPEDCLKTMYLQCSAASERMVLGQEAVLACSIGHEALLQRVFKGDFNALLAWWRSHREPAEAN